ncbi:hypothetical protein [Peribacillus frigoritolerans]|uniref:hypothetical protein n=1 Tax=Peribacillus frigoritolerans TaxID=450367 RepID=UPI0020BD7F11|nr:hypothetical protein [Peribacillus frigoritolerans]
MGEPLWPERYGNTFINEERRNAEVKAKKVQEEKKATEKAKAEQVAKENAKAKKKAEQKAKEEVDAIDITIDKVDTPSTEDIQ